MDRIVAKYCSARVQKSIQLEQHNYDCFENETETSFFFITSNILYKVKNEYVPNEISIIEFNFEQGIRKTFHRNLNHEVPGGMSFECRIQTIRNHIEPQFKDPGGEDHGKIFEDIIDFFGHRNQLVMYCEDSKLEQNINVAQWFHQKFRDKYSLSNFVIQMFGYRKLAQEFYEKSNTMISEEGLWTLLQPRHFESFLYNQCNYHRMLRSNRCSLDIGHKSVYAFLFTMAIINGLPLRNQIPNLDSIKVYLSKIVSKYSSLRHFL